MTIELSYSPKGGSGKRSLPMVVLRRHRTIGKPFGLAAATRQCRVCHLTVTKGQMT